MVADVKPDRSVLNSSSLNDWLNRLGPLLGLVVVIAIFSLLMDSPGRYLSANNLRIVFAQTVIVAIGAIGMTMIIISGGIDLAVGSTVALTGVITALALNAGLPPISALAIGVFALAGRLVAVARSMKAPLKPARKRPRPRPRSNIR